MEETLEKIDAIRKRTHAIDVLAIAGEDLLRTLATLIRRGNASRIIVKSGNSVVVDIPVTLGVDGGVLAPWGT